MRRLGRVGVVLVLVIGLAGCSADPTTSSEYMALEDEVEVLRSEVAAGDSEIASLTAQLSEMSATLNEAEAAKNADDESLPPIVEAFQTAYESGDLETVKNLYTEDGIITTTGRNPRLVLGQRLLARTMGQGRIRVRTSDQNP